MVDALDLASVPRPLDAVLDAAVDYESSNGTPNALFDWLLDSDPAIRWQVMGDLTDASPDDIDKERTHVAAEGWGARLLGLQDGGGNWGGGAYSPKWIFTTYTLLLLRHLGIHPGDPRSELPSVWCGRRCGWGARISPSSSISVRPAERAFDGDRAVSEARHRAHEYLLDRRLMYRLSDRALIDERWLLLSFPPGWFYDVLRALDYLAEAGFEPNERCSDAIEVIRRKQRNNGIWPLQGRHPGKEHFAMEQPGKSSRWNTLRAMRVLHWYG